MTTTIVDMLSTTVGEEYNKQAIAAGDTVIYLLPKSGMVTIQLNTNTTGDTSKIHSSTENYSVIKSEVNLDSFVEEVAITGGTIQRTFDHGCTAYAVECLTGTITASRIRALRNGNIYRG